MNTKIILVTLLIATLVLFGCTQTPSGNALMSLDKDKNIDLIDANLSDSNTNVFNNLDDFRKVKAGDNISVDYTGRLTDGTIFDSSIGKKPQDFTVGAGQMIKGFDEGVVGMKLNEKKTITLAPEQAYGKYDSNLIRFYDINAPELSILGNLKVGMELAVGGIPIIGIIEVNDNNVAIDFNHKLAGKTLVFEITLVSFNN